MVWQLLNKRIFIGLIGIAVLVLGAGIVYPLFSLAGGTEENKGITSQFVAASKKESTLVQSNVQALQSLEEDERTGGFKPGMGLAESSLREQAGDLPGAVFAAFKEVLFAYQYGYLSASQIDERLQAVEKNFPGNQEVAAAIGACKALLSGKAQEGLTKLKALDLELYTLDSFPRWMERVFVLQDAGKAKGKTTGSAVWDEYLATRSRYINYPLYWLVFARHSDGAQRMDGAERCVSLAPQGPYAEEGRSLLAIAAGLSKRDSTSIKTRLEIEQIIETVVATNTGDGLKELLPLLALPDNPYTLYALGACRGLATQENFARYFQGEMKKSSGRLHERLRYILGGQS